ncbi:MAG: succinylglutamate desuccinylase/aspartoacylase family protein [Pseudomonadota bacterium]
MSPVSGLFDLGEATSIRGVRILRGDEPGPTVGFLGMIHGNEPAGAGLWKFAEKLGRPARGEIHLIVGHPDAMAAEPGGVRYLKDDLNRLFLDDHELKANGVDLDGPDYRRMLELKPALAALDVLVDIHTTSQPSEPFVIGYTAQAEAHRLSRSLPVTQVDGLHQFIHGSACQWVLDRGCAALPIEVGAHLDPSGPGHASDLAQRILAELGMLPKLFMLDTTDISTRAKRVVVRKHIPHVLPDFRYVRHFANFDSLIPGEIIGSDSSGDYHAPNFDHPVIFMPSSESSLRDGSNTDAFFFGMELASNLSRDIDEIAMTA